MRLLAGVCTKPLVGVDAALAGGKVTNGEFAARTYDACCAACISDPECWALTYYTTRQWCVMVPATGYSETPYVIGGTDVTSSYMRELGGAG